MPIRAIPLTGGDCPRSLELRDGGMLEGDNTREGGLVWNTSPGPNDGCRCMLCCILCISEVEGSLGTGGGGCWPLLGITITQSAWFY